MHQSKPILNCTKMQYYIQLFSLLACFIRLGGAQYPCTTPDYTYGYCTDARQCSYLYNFWLSNQYYLLYYTYCGQTFGYGSVCCPYQAINTGPSTITTPPPRPITTPPPISTTTPVVPNVGLLPQPGTCGVNIKNRIIYGKETEITEFPWMALIEYTNLDKTKSLACGGVLIDKNFVLTASHCVNRRALTTQGRKLSGVRLGDWDTTSDPDCVEREKQNCADPFKHILVSEIIIHEAYNPDSNLNDIALLRLEHPVNYTYWIQPICLPLSSEVVDAIGEGVQLEVAGSPSDVKKKAMLSVVTHTRCNNEYRNNGFTMTNGHLCAQGDDRQDSCRGDSGGPLMYQHKNGLNVHYYLAGIVSFGGRECGQPGVPSVYTRVDQYINWILAKLARLT
ncbi:serine protease easter-like isoform X2 [Contarinia nasturtii]|uniref:serine protease easter-like isoform X2 n=1 Tax=Contarinia nasturtii TaxID=265458 RepID=UPI0012D3E836|nr:serine protease easter-like isoform X2 [Contarinia nasturtii]